MKTKTFDSVKSMRELRARIGRDMESMSSGERIRYIRGKAASIALGRRLAREGGDAAGQADAADRPSAGC